MILTKSTTVQTNKILIIYKYVFKSDYLKLEMEMFYCKLEMKRYISNANTSKFLIPLWAKCKKKIN